ncbi:MAG TPA: hypothetical protein VKB05_12065 [Pyrinomonadaceae bacterium]|nr:hypothetical protein [Pyrinomonadaceae bacterium]
MDDAEYHAARQRMLTAWHKGDLTDAQAALRLVLSTGSPAMKAESLLYQGMMVEGRGELEEAKASWFDALQYARDGTFLKFELEASIAAALERDAQLAEAMRWFRSALETCCRGDQFAGSKALAGYLRIAEGKIEPADEAVVACVVEKSWRVLDFPGEPDANDWATSAAKLVEKSIGQAAKIIEEADRS